MKANRFLALLLTMVMLLGLMPTTMFPVSAAEDTPNEEVAEEEYPKNAEYDFTIPGSTISFLDKDGVLMTEEEGWSYGDNVVHTWYIFMYRTTKDDLKLGYSTEGKLFLPHRVYEGDTADLLYVKDNTMFRVTATKDAEQIFDGSQLLKTIPLNATNGTITLANAPVLAETPFGFVYMGATDENGSFSLNATTGEFKLWISSNAGYILNKTVTVTDTTDEISFADEINNAVEIDITARSETYEEAPGYMLALGKPNETNAENMLTTSYISPDKTVFVTPGAYSIACGIWVEDKNPNSSTATSGGLWIDLNKNATVNQNTAYRFSLADFEVKFGIQDAYKQDSYGIDDRIAFRLNAEHPDGYVMSARANRSYDQDALVITVGENQYPYTFCQDSFSVFSSGIKVYKNGDESNPVYHGDIGLNESGLTLSLFGETENEYIVKCFSEWDSMSFPWLFPDGVWYTTSFKTQSIAGIYKTFESDTDFSLFYFDENGVMSEAVYDYRDGKRFYYISASVQNGDYLLAASWSYDWMKYNIIPVSDELFANGYQFVDRTNLSQVEIVVANGENDEAYYDTTFDLTIEAGNRQFKICGSQPGLQIPYGEYVFDVYATSYRYDDEYHILDENVVLHTERRTVSEASCTIDVDYSTYPSFTVEAGMYVDRDYEGNYRKHFALHYADGSVKNVGWPDAPATLYCSTMPQYATGEMYYYAWQEMVPFSPYVTIEPFDIEEGKTYRFDFKPTAIEFTGPSVFDSSENTVLTYKVTDGCGNVLTDIWNLLNPGGVHNPLTAKEYPFRDRNGDPVDNQYTVDVYFRVKGESEYRKMSFNDFSKADLGRLAAGEYEGYLEIDFDTYLDEYVVEYPMEKGVYENESWGEFNSVYDNISRVLHGVLHRDFSFTVVEQSHTCNFGAWVDDVVTDTHTRTCKDPECGKTETKPHDWDDGVQNGTPTCTEGATVTYTCAGCGKTKTEDVDHLGHDWSEWTDDGENAPTDTHSRTCQRDGCDAAESESHGWSRWVKIDDKTHKKSCFVCEGTRTAAHNLDDGVVTKEATHLETGVKTFTCTDLCGYYYTEDIPKIAEHQWGEWLNNNNNGTHTRYCRCGATETKDCTYDAGVVTKEATHFEEGEKTYTCNECDGIKTETIPKTTEHQWGEWLNNNNNGTHTRYCRCGATETKDCTYDAGVVTKEATHFEEGEKTYICNECDGIKTEAIPKIAEHQWGEWLNNNNNGTHTRYCRCGATETKDCTYNAGVVTKEATHFEEGEKLYTCTDCGGKKTETIAKITEHEWTEWLNNNNNGTHTRYCRCGATETKDCTYNAGIVTKEATHFEEGEKLYTCTDCGGKKTETIAKITEHEWTEWLNNNNNGTHTRYCRCGATETKDCTYDAGVVTKEATHFEEGEKLYTCTDCGGKKTETIAKTTEHEWTEWHDNGDGTHTRACRCNATETKDCTYDDGVVTTEPTYEATGIKTYTCTDCGGKKTETLNMLVKTDEIVSPDNSKIKITAPEGSDAVLNENTVLKVEEVKDEIAEDVKANVQVVAGNDNAEILVSYDVSLLLDGATVQPGGKVEVTLPAPENAGDFDTLQVVYIDDEGNVTPCETRVNADGTVTFVTDHFSRYAIVGVRNSSPVVWILISAIGVALIAGAVVAVLVIKKKKSIA